MKNSHIKTKVIGVDISILNTQIGIVDIRGNIIAKTAFANKRYTDVNEFIMRLSMEIIQLAEKNGGLSEIRSVGVSAPSTNYKTGCIENAANLPWKGVVPLAVMLRDRIGIAVVVCDDCLAVAMGEQTFGSAHGMSNFICVSLGHGVGSAIYANDNYIFGHNGFSGEIGHTCCIDKGRQCSCGKRGCFEAYVGATGIVTTARELMAESDKPSLMKDYGDDLDPKDITDCCDKGDELAIETYRRTGRILGIGLANAASIFDPEAIILTGGLSLAGHWLFDPCEESFTENVFHNLKDKVRILSSILDRERDLLGASALAWRVEEYSLFK